MKSNNKKVILLTIGVFLSAILIFTVFLCPLLLIANESINNKGASEISGVELSGSGSQTLNYGYYIYSTNYVGYRIRWSYESSNPDVGITVLVMTSDEYTKYKSSQACTYSLLSDGTHVSDSGAFEVPFEDYWVIMFMNTDPDQQQTYLTYEISIEQVNPMQIISTVITVLVVVVVVVAVVVTVVLVVVKKRKPKHVLSQSISSPQANKYSSYTQIFHEKSASNIPGHPDSKQNWLFCPYCGEKGYLGAQFCVNCGRELKNQNV